MQIGGFNQVSAVEDRTLDLDLLGFWLDLYVQVELRFFCHNIGHTKTEACAGEDRNAIA